MCAVTASLTRDVLNESEKCMTPEDQTVCIATFPRDREAEMARMALESNGIECLLSKDDCGGMRPYLQFTTGIRISVKQSEAIRAQEILDDLRREERQ